MKVSQTDFAQGCSADSCTFAQKRLPGAETRAPFSGVVRKWRVVSRPGPQTYQLVVLHKKDNGKYKNVGVSSLGVAPEQGVFEFQADMQIHKGDYIGIQGGPLGGVLNPNGRTMEFAPGLEFPDSRKPSSSGLDELQYNATIKR
jgi:hypothetical protein